MTPGYIRAVFASSRPEPDSYLNGLPAVRYLLEGGRLEFDAPVTFLVGENGTGKSTLLEAIAVGYGFNAEGGGRNFNFSIRATHSELCRHLTLSRTRYPKDGFFLRAESFYNVASNIDDLDEGSGELLAGYGGISLHKQSHGESFLALVQNRFWGKGLYLLDEPEAALSPSRLLTLMGQSRLLVQADSQFIIATHSPILRAYPGACIYQLSSEGVRRVNYKETEYYCLTRRFLENPEKMLQYLFDGGWAEE
ncbi:ABC transporter ATP-binding protein [Pseudoflavonifractor sp. 524-17]|uniref:AAA family ATPase n=1 Tax=Pseudoflavonifractor sp. 524-17 TaxID=2304577 RepID=UPI001379835B|nr:AAA family ATPase [Pseudoflavonifractor sp. 524-17]NCE65196.1 ABC transporter ATP-binding protein [Pseudoflavonifractor sp. 524-17]